jgi:hypothetical protein
MMKEKNAYRVKDYMMDDMWIEKHFFIVFGPPKLTTMVRYVLRINDQCWVILFFPPTKQPTRKGLIYRTWFGVCGFDMWTLEHHFRVLCANQCWASIWFLNTSQPWVIGNKINFENHEGLGF